MLQKRTIVDQVEVTRTGIVQVRMNKQIVEDGKVLAQDYHRTSIEPGTSPAERIAVVNAHLAQMGCAPVTDEEWNRVAVIVEAVHTDEVKDAFAAARKAAA